MSCICQYIVNSSPSLNGVDLLASVALPEEAETTSASATPIANQEQLVSLSSREAVTDDKKISVCISDLAACRSENWLLKKKLRENEITIENLEQLMTTIVNKQHQVLSDMFQLRKRNHELQNECNLQREFNAVERNKLMKELHELKTRYNVQTLIGTEDEDHEESHTGESESRKFDKSLTNTDSDEDCSYDLDSEDDAQSINSSAESSAISSVNSSPYSTQSETDDNEDSGEESQESQQEENTASEYE